MTIADRIQALRKAKGISQEELADKIGVSRQAVSKWESEQSMPDLEKVVFLSEFFDVTTDYLLRGIETEKIVAAPRLHGNIFVMIATALNLLGLFLACAVWHEEQSAMALVIGFIFMACGVLTFGVGMYFSAPETKAAAKHIFWEINIWILIFMPLAAVYNLCFSGVVAPYPLMFQPVILYPLFWAVYIAICLAVMYAQRGNAKKQK